MNAITTWCRSLMTRLRSRHAGSRERPELDARSLRDIGLDRREVMAGRGGEPLWRL